MDLPILAIVIVSFYQLQSTTAAVYHPTECSGFDSRALENSYIEWKVWMESHEIDIHFKKIWSFRQWIDHFCRQAAHNRRYQLGYEFYLMGTNEFSHRNFYGIRRRLLQKPVWFNDNHNEQYRHVVLPPKPIPNSVNWATAGWTFPVETQQGIPKGWMISALGAIEAHLYNATGFKAKLSRWELMDCIAKLNGVAFISADAFSYVQRHGVALESFYPKWALNAEACRNSYKRKHERIKIKSHKMLKPYSEENLQRAVALIGPISVNMKVTDNFLFYRTGVFYDFQCLDGGPFTNHAVLLVGYGRHPYGGPFWIIQNNWGVHWGENGFARIARDTLVHCEIHASAFYPVLFS